MIYLPLYITLLIVLATLAIFNIIVFILSKIKKWNNFLSINDLYISARNQHGIWTLSFSLISSALGSWILFIPPQLSYLYGSLPSILYGIAIFLPIMFMSYISPIIRKTSPTHSFTLGDFILYKMGPTHHILFVSVSCLAMFLSFTGELMFFSQSISLITPSLTKYITIPMISMLTWMYTMMGGLSGSILSDFYQTLIIGVIIIVGYIVMIVDTKLDIGEFVENMAFTGSGLRAGVIMIISFFPAFLIDQTSWQRVWAGKDIKSVRIGLIIAAIVTVCVVFLVGMGGVFARTLDGSIPRDSYTAFLLLIINSNQIIIGFFLLLLTVLVSSSLDSALIATTAVIASLLRYFNISIKWIFPVSLLFIILSILVAIFYQQSALLLMLMGNIFAATLTFPIFLGLTPYHTNIGSLLSIFVGIFSVGLYGLINTHSIKGFFIAYTLPYELDSIESIITLSIALFIPLITSIFIKIILFLYKFFIVKNNDLTCLY